MKKLTMTLTLVAALALTILPATASAGTIQVEETGSADTASCVAPLYSTPCATISYALAGSVDNDTIQIGIGTFPTKYNAIGQKSLTIIGAGPDKTFVDGENATDATGNGMFRFNRGGTASSISNLSIIRPAQRSVGPYAYVIIAQPGTADPPTAAALSVNNVDIVGNGVNDLPISAAHNSGNIALNDLALGNIAGIGIYLEQTTGEVSITNSTVNMVGAWPLPSVNPPSAISFYNFGSSGYLANGPHTISGNTFSGGGVGFTGDGRAINDIEIAENDFSSISGSLLNLTGVVDDVSITGNSLRGGSVGINLGLFGTAVPTNVSAHGNQIVDNTSGVTTAPGETVAMDLDRNWWGCNEGPTIDETPPAGDCDSVTTPAANAANITLDNWVVLRLAATPTPKLFATGVASLSTGFDQLNTGVAAPAIFADGTVLPMTSTGGSLASASPTLTSSVTTNSFTSGGTTNRSASATFDHETVTHTWDDAPVVTITAPVNGLITKNANVTLGYTVTPSSGVTCNIANGASVPLSPGANSIVVICTDSAGNSDYDSISVIRDITPPVVTIVAPVDGSITSAASVQLNFTVTNDYGTVTCNRTDGEVIALDEGPTTITVSCTDQAGNVGGDAVTVTRDTTPPSVSITAPTDGSTTTSATATLNFVASDVYSSFSCVPTNGSNVPLNFGINTLTVTCTDAVGNVGTDAVTVIRTSNTPPVVTITSPVGGATINAATTTLTYNAASQDGTVSCTPPSGTNVALAVGVNTLTVNCTDNFGNVASASVTVYHPDALPTCAKDVSITEVTRVGSRTRIRGVARLQFSGQKVKLQYQPTGSKTAGTAIIRPDGSFTAVVSRPAKPSYKANNARYRALLGSTSTAWIKITRRMGATAVTYDGNGRLAISGSVSKPLIRGQKLRVQRSDACGAYRQIGSLTIKSDGTFKGSVASGGGSQAAVFIRLAATVGNPSNPRARSNTYSIVQPVVVER